MNQPDRRSFFKLLGAGTLGAAALESSIGKALALPANNKTGTIQDVEHIVVLMQENRSFDHYFGTLQGVRGFSDPRVMELPSGKPVWYQPNGSNGYVLPFHPDAPDMGLQFLQDLPHDWESTHVAWNEGRWNRWVPSKSTTTMAYMTREDIPFHYALADAFTICDAYHCSILSSTDPNRYYMWTGWCGNDGKGGGPVIDNAEAGYGWQTYPERLETAGITWKIYQDVGVGLTAAGFWGWTSDPYIGNYGDNSLLYFHQYQNARAGTPLAKNAKTGTNISVSGTLFDEFRNDVKNGTLPQVSWIAAPEAYTEHPNWPANYGAWYVAQMLDILTSNPDVWSKTVFLLTYDENDGFFDHMVSPTPPMNAAHGKSTVAITNEIFHGDSSYSPGPYGLGVRVPMLIISPWSKGGYVNSQVFDHTSIIRFIEQRFGQNNPALVEPNITPWRRVVSGDLTSAFNFRTPNDTVVALPSTTAYLPPDALRHPDYTPVPPTAQAMPQQEAGIRRARALPYGLEVRGASDYNGSSFNITFGNTGTVGAVYLVREGQISTPTAAPPRSYTVEPGKNLADTWLPAGNGRYDLSVHGPNGYFRRFIGSLSAAAGVDIVVQGYDDATDNAFGLEITNRGDTALWLVIEDAYTGKKEQSLLQAPAPGTWSQTLNLRMPVGANHGWYDFIVTVVGNADFKWRLAGHVETGRDSYTDPLLGKAAPQA